MKKKRKASRFRGVVRGFRGVGRVLHTELSGVKKNMKKGLRGG